MKRFIVNVLFFSSFLLALAIGMECMLRRVPNTYAFKRSLMEEYQDLGLGQFRGRVRDCSFLFPVRDL